MANQSTVCHAKNSERSSLFLIGPLIGPLIGLLIGLGCLLLLAACQPRESQTPVLQQWVFSGPIMGTEYRITVRSQPDVQAKLIEKAAVNAMQLINQSMSTYIADSELNRLNRAPANQPFDLSPDLAEVLSQAISIHQKSNGAFDVTLAKVINLWGFGAEGRIESPPSDQLLNELRTSIGLDKLTVQETDNGYSAIKKIDELTIDLSAIAKGYAVDKVATVLTQLGIDDYLINIGGELRAAGYNAEGAGWRVGIEKPQLLGGIQQVVRLNNEAIATSGDYRNYIEIEGQRFSHTIDPDSLKPVFHRLALVSVVHPSASIADALATAMMAMGVKRAIEFANDNNIAAYFVIRDAESSTLAYQIRHSDKFKQYLL